MPRFAAFGVMLDFCHTSNVILTFSILSYQDGPKYVIKTMLLGAPPWCHGAKVSHVQRNINFFDFKISRWSKICNKNNAFGCVPLVSRSICLQKPKVCQVFFNSWFHSHLKKLQNMQ